MAKEPPACPYLIDGRLCKAIGEEVEGKDVRTIFCDNDLKNYCCYLCSNQEKCEISCTYLDKLEEQSDLDRTAAARIDKEITRYQEELARLSVLLVDGKIGEESYLVATNTVEGRIDELKRTKENPSLLRASQQAPIRAGQLEGIGREKIGKPSSLWYLVPFLFGIIGGIVGYIGVRDEDRGMADGLLMFGIVWSLLALFLYFVILNALI